MNLEEKRGFIHRYKNLLLSKPPSGIGKEDIEAIWPNQEPNLGDRFYDQFDVTCWCFFEEFYHAVHHRGDTDDWNEVMDYLHSERDRGNILAIEICAQCPPSF